MFINSSKESDPQAYYTTYDTAKQTHLDSLLAKINFNALTSVASKARSGIRCRIPTLYLDLKQAVLSQIGGQNCQLDLEFDDGVTWIVRLRLCDPLLPPRPFQDYIFLSEVATLKFLAETAVPSPKVVIFTSSNHLETKSALHLFLWRRFPERPCSGMMPVQSSVLKSYSS